MRKIGLGVGLVATVLLPLALSLFGVLGGRETVAAILLLSGAWAFVFGMLMEAKDERLYYSGFGALVALALIPALTRPGAKKPSVPQAGQGP